MIRRTRRESFVESYYLGPPKIFAFEVIFEAQMLEDALTLCFFEFQFADLAERTEEAKMIGILQKAWKKISLEAQKIALELPLPERERALLDKALKPTP